MDNEDTLEVSSKKLNEAKYSKINADGSVDSSRLQDEDYEFTKRFIKAAFPDSTQVQRDLELTLRRTFVLGRKNQKMQRSLATSSPSKKPKLKRKSKPAETPSPLRKHQSKVKFLKSIGVIKNEKVPPRLPYADFVEINSMWNSYVAELCGSDTDPNEIQAKLNKMDLHGAHVKVLKNSEHNANHVLEGIVLKETKETFQIVTVDNKSRLIPKKDTILEVKLEKPAGTMQIVGNMFRTRPAERVCKKMKSFVDFVGVDAYKRQLIYSQLNP